MARLPRYVMPGQPQHIIQRGNNRQIIFAADADYQFFRDALVDASRKHGLQIHAYVWMTNHIHLLATPQFENSISKVFQSVGRKYVQNSKMGSDTIILCQDQGIQVDWEYMPYQYKVVPFIGRIKGNQTSVDVASQLEGVINQHAAQGWELYQLSNVDIEVQPGCIAGLLGAKVSYIRYDQLIFRRASA